MVKKIYPKELKLNRTISSNTEAPFLDINLSISNGIIISDFYDKRDDYDFDTGNNFVSKRRRPTHYVMETIAVSPFVLPKHLSFIINTLNKTISLIVP